MTPKISAYIIAYNEEKNIKAAVQSVLWADEVVVIDSFSTDATVSIAESLGARVVQVAFEGFGKLRRDAIAATQYEWVFSLDTDERCTHSVRDEIVEILASHTPCDAYYVPRRNYFMAQEVKHSGWYPDYRQPQIFKRDALVFNDDQVHEGYEVVGTVGFLKNAIWQIPYRSLSQLIGKMERYSSLGAVKLQERGKEVSMFKAFTHGSAAFFRHYILKGGFLDGWVGFVIAFGNFEGTFYRYAKAVEAKHGWQQAGEDLDDVIR